MEFETRVQYLNPEHGRRAVVISDIHAHKEWLERLLEKVQFGEKDILIILGDLIEKGPESLATIRYVMELTEKYEVYPLMGNVDLWRLEMLLCEDGSLDEELYRTNKHMLDWWGHSFFDDLCREMGVKIYGQKDVPAARKAAAERFKKELDFIKGLPTILETPAFTFVHGGLVYEKLEENFSLPPMKLLKNDDFISQGKHFSKYVVVGHWPVCLYRADLESSAPYISEEQKIISIDGGCGIKRDDQLNALLIPDLYEERMDWESVDAFPEVTALDDQEGTPLKLSDESTPHSIYIRYFESEVEILKVGPEFSLAEHVKTGYRLRIYNGFLAKPPVEGERNDCWEYTDYRLPVKAGERVSLLYATSEGCLMRKRGVAGWYGGRVKA